MNPLNSHTCFLTFQCHGIEYIVFVLLVCCLTWCVDPTICIIVVGESGFIVILIGPILTITTHTTSVSQPSKSLVHICGERRPLLQIKR